MSTSNADSPEPVAYRPRPWCAKTSISRSKLYELIKEGQVQAVKCGSATLIVTSPSDFLKSLSTKAA
jgi:predicted site-specific integrase-resolvase